MTTPEPFITESKMQEVVGCYTDSAGAWLQQAASVTAVDSSGAPVPVYVNGGV